MAQKLKEIGTGKMVVFKKAVPFHQRDEVFNKLIQSKVDFEMMANYNITIFTVTSKIYLEN